MNTQDNKPLRGPKYRSRAFQEYLLRQTPERAAEILAGERAFNELREDPGTVAAVAAAWYTFDLLDKIPTDTPAGPGWRSRQEMLDEISAT